MLYNPEWKPAEVIAPVQTETWRNVLLDVANLLQSRGWVRGHFHNSQGYCLVGALESAEIQRRYTASEVMVAHGKLAAAVQGHNIMAWNDNPRRTKEVVIAKVLEVATSGEVYNLITIDSSSWTGR